MEAIGELLKQVNTQGLAAVLAVGGVYLGVRLIVKLFAKLDDKDRYISDLHEENVQLQKTTTEALRNVEEAVRNTNANIDTNNRLIENLSNFLSNSSK